MSDFDVSSRNENKITIYPKTKMNKNITVPIPKVNLIVIMITKLN